MRLDILKAGIVKLLEDNAIVMAESGGRIHQNRALLPESGPIPTAVIIELAAWPGEDATLSGPLPQTESLVRIYVDGTDIWSISRTVSEIRTMFHMTEHIVTVASFGELSAQTEVPNINDADTGIYGDFETVLEVSFFWRTTPE